jgi:hypothetical protein
MSHIASSQICLWKMKLTYQWFNSIPGRVHTENPIFRILQKTGCTPKISERRLLKVRLAEGCILAGVYAFIGGESSGATYYERREEVIFQEYQSIKVQAQHENAGADAGGQDAHKDNRTSDYMAAPRALPKVLLITHYRKPFKATGDRYGLANIDTKVGDVIGILHGSKVPVILRPSPNNTFQVVGQCYLEGCMYGEAVSWKESEALGISSYITAVVIASLFRFDRATSMLSSY